MVKMDDKSRVIIPKRVRETAGIAEKCMFFVYAFEDLVFLRKADVDKSSIIRSLEKLKEVEAGSNVE